MLQIGCLAPSAGGNQRGRLVTHIILSVESTSIFRCRTHKGTQRLCHGKGESAKGEGVCSSFIPLCSVHCQTLSQMQGLLHCCQGFSLTCTISFIHMLLWVHYTHARTHARTCTLTPRVLADPVNWLYGLKKTPNWKMLRHIGPFLSNIVRCALKWLFSSSILSHNRPRNSFSRKVLLLD